MRSRDPSPSRGQMTITLKTNATSGEVDETARVRIEVNNPELVAERVVNQLAKRFPPESVVTLATTNGGGGTTTEDEETMICGTEDGETISSERHLSNGSWKPKRNPRLLPSDCGSVEHVQDLWSSQYYLVSGDLDMAVPVCENQERVRLCDRSSIPVNPNDVITVWHDETGHATVAGRGYTRQPPTLSAEIPVPVDNRGISRFAQDFLISEDLERAVPLCPGQTQVHLIDDNELTVNPADVYTVHYGDRGLALFHRRSDGSVHPGLPLKPGLAYCAVPHRVRSTAATPLSAARVPIPRDGRTDVHVVLYDDHGLPICVRGPTGGLAPDGLRQKGAACSLEYYWTPAKGSSTRISVLGPDNRATLVNGEVVSVTPTELSSVMRHRESHVDDKPVLPTKINNRHNQRDSYEPNRRRQSPHAWESPVDHFQETSTLPKKVAGDRQKLRGRDPSPVDTDDYYDEPRRRRHSPPPWASQIGARRRHHSPTAWAAHTASTTDSVFDDEEDERIIKLNRRDPTAEGYARSQTYFLPADFAIPVQADQSHVRLANGDKLIIQNSQTFTVEYERRGFPMKTLYSDGSIKSWIPNRQGVGAKFQDYFVHKDLLAAVPIRAGQTEVVLNDGTTVSVPESNVMTVFYDGSGRAAFTISGSKRRIRPGLVPKSGVAHSVQYLNVIGADDGSGEQYVIPFKTWEKEVPDPRRPARKLPVNRKAITVAFFDKSKNPLYTQLPNGTIIGGGLAGSRLTTSEETSSTAFDNSSLLSDSSASALKLAHTERVRRISLGGTIRPFGARKDSRDLNQLPFSKRSRSPNEEETQSARTSNEVSVRSKRQEIIEIRVPVQQIEYIDKVVEVPEIHYVDKHVEVEQIEWQTKIVKKKEVIERPVEHIKYVPKIETKIVEHILEKQEYIEVPVPKIIEQKKKIDRFVDTKKNITVQQSIRPVIKDTLDIFEDVECLTLEPELIPVDVFVPRLVKSRLIAVGTTKEQHKEMDVPLAHYNSLLLKMNPTFASNYEKLPMIKNTSGSFPLLPSDQQVTVLAPTADEITQVLKAAGVVSRSATPGEAARLVNRARRRSTTDEESVGQFAPRTCVISPF